MLLVCQLLVDKICTPFCINNRVAPHSEEVEKSGKSTYVTPRCVYHQAGACRTPGFHTHPTLVSKPNDLEVTIPWDDIANLTEQQGRTFSIVLAPAPERNLLVYNLTLTYYCE